MKNEQRLKQLEMALTKHNDLIIDIGDNQYFKLVWDEDINEYRGISLQTGIQIGIWNLEFLFDVVNGKEKNIKMEVYNEKHR